MSVDIELEELRQEWLSQAEALPDLRRRIRRQNVRSAAAVVLLAACLAVSTTRGLQEPGSFWAGAACGVWLTTLLAGTYAWWVRRGTWVPSAQTTQAYLELTYRRAMAKERTLRFSTWFLALAIGLFVARMALTSTPFSATEAVILAGAGMELLLFAHFRRQNRRDIDENYRLMEQTMAWSDDASDTGGESQP